MAPDPVTIRGDGREEQARATITNRGETQLSGFDLAGLPNGLAGEFDSACRRLAPGDQCGLSIILDNDFQTALDGRDFTATVTAGSVPRSLRVLVRLDNVSVQPGSVTLTLADDSMVVTVTNEGATVVPSVAIVETADEFRIGGSECDGELGPGATCRFSIDLENDILESQETLRTREFVRVEAGADEASVLVTVEVVPRFDLVARLSNDAMDAGGCPEGPGSCIHTVTYSVRNAGASRAPATVAEIAVLENAPALVDVPAIDPGRTHTASVRVVGGNCWNPDCLVVLTVDRTGILAETDESNNRDEWFSVG